MSDDYFDLVVWYERDEKRVHGFQMSYDKEGQERAVTWIRGEAVHHCLVDTGEALPTANHAPILVPGGDFVRTEVIAEFERRSARLSPELRRLVLSKLKLGGLQRLAAICSHPLFLMTASVVVILAIRGRVPSSGQAEFRTDLRLTCSNE